MAIDQIEYSIPELFSFNMDSSGEVVFRRIVQCRLTFDTLVRIHRVKGALEKRTIRRHLREIHRIPLVIAI